MLLCVVLHGNITASLDRLLLTGDSMGVDATFATYVAAAVAVIVLTKGRLGYRGPAPLVTG